MQVDAWSKSSLKSLLENCSWQWALRKVYNIEDHGSPATAMGTGYHKALEEWEKSGRTLTLEEMQKVAADAAFEECKKLPMSQWFEHATDPEQVIELAKESVRLWASKPSSKGVTIKDLTESRKFISAEQYFNETFKDFGIHGFTDGIYHDDINIYVVDHKTASSMRRWTYEQAPSIEVAMYLAFAQKGIDKGIFPNLPVLFEYHIVSAKESKTRVVECGEFTWEHSRILTEALSDADAIARNDAFRPKPDWNLCSSKYCAYFEGCRVTGTLSPYHLTISNVPTPDTSTFTPIEVPAEG
jgi:hypothetical protein